MTEQTIAQAETVTAKPAALLVNQPQLTSAPEQITRNLSGRGEVYSYTIMYNVPHGFEEQKPYVVALVKLVEGPLVTAQLTDVEHQAVTIGMPVEMVTRKLREDGPEGQIIYGYKFRPILHEIA